MFLYRLKQIIYKLVTSFGENCKIGLIHPTRKLHRIFYGYPIEERLGVKVKLFYARQQYTAIARIYYGDSVLVSWCLSRPGTVSSRGEIETSGFHDMIAYCP